MTQETKDPQVENALLRGALYLALKSLHRYQGAPIRELEPDRDGNRLFEVTVTDETRQRAAEAIARGDKLLRDDGQGRRR